MEQKISNVKNWFGMTQFLVYVFVFQFVQNYTIFVPLIKPENDQKEEQNRKRTQNLREKSS